MKADLAGASEPHREEIISLRRHFHMYPELSAAEHVTSETIQQRLTGYGIPFTAGYAETGVLGIIEGGRPGSTVALRADMDALPIAEKNGYCFASRIEGVMHACGHDAHMAMLLGAGMILSETKESLPGRVLLVFQPAEEMSPTGGARRMLEDGVFRDHPPAAIFAQHVWPELPVGQVGVRQGAMTGASDRFRVTIEGTGGHASRPHQTVDAIVVASQIINSLQTVVSRDVDPLGSAVLTIGKIRGGSRYNAVAEKVMLEGTIRTFQPETKDMVKSRFYAIVEGVAQSMECEARVEYWDGYPPTVNIPEWADRVRETTNALLGSGSTPKLEPSMGAEDFGRFLLEVPGAYLRLGTATPGDSQTRRLHDSGFDIDESALPVGTELMAQLALDSLRQLAGH